MENNNIKKHFFYSVEEQRWGNEIKPNYIRIALCIICLVLLLSSFIVIPTGYTGVRSTFGQIDPEPLDPGINARVPIVQKIEKVNNKQQDIEIKDKIWSETFERTALFYENITVTYTISPEFSAWIYSNVSSYKKSLVNSTIVASAIKTASKQLNSSDATNRGLVEPLTERCLQDALDSKYGVGVVVVNKVVISNADFEEAYNKAIADKQNAQILYEQQQIENQKRIEQSEAEVKIKKNQAEAEAVSKKITAEASAEAILIEAEANAKANEMLTQSLTEDILRKMYYEKWDGKLPEVMGDEVNPFVTVK